MTELFGHTSAHEAQKTLKSTKQLRSCLRKRGGSSAPLLWIHSHAVCGRSCASRIGLHSYISKLINGNFSGTSTEWLFVHCFQVELKFGNVGFCGGRKTGVPGEKPSEQGREPTTNSTRIWRQLGESNPGDIDRRRVLSPLRHPCSSRTHLDKWGHTSTSSTNDLSTY